MMGSITTGSAASINYTYSKNGNRLTMTDPQGGTTSFTFDTIGRRTALNHSNGIQTTYTHCPGIDEPSNSHYGKNSQLSIDRSQLTISLTQ